MEWLELSVHTTTAGADLASQALMTCGANGTMIEDRADIPDPAKPSGYWELIDPKLIDSMPEDVVVKAWFQTDETLADHISALQSQLAALKAQSPDMELGTLAVTTAQVKDEDWSEVWKRFYKPFRAGKSLVVKPSWEPYDPRPGDQVIEIDPGMAFGTGTHETTGMCLAFLEDYLKPGMRVIDVGTGSGILAIGARLLGGENVMAIDIDPTAVKVAKENVIKNHLEGQIDVREGDLLKQVDAVCDLCVANIIADVICFFSEPLRGHIAENGLFICSGIIKEREQDVVDALTAAHYTLVEKRYKGEWVAMIWRR